jgi:hypothetical protein
MGDFDQVPPPEKGGSSSLKWILGGCCSCLLLGSILFAVFTVFGAQKVMEAIETYKTEARAFLEEAAVDPEAAYASRFSAPLKAEQSLEEFKAGVTGNPDLFTVQDISINSVNNVNGRVRIKGTITSKSGAIRNCAFVFIEEDGARRLIGYRITSDPIPD